MYCEVCGIVTGDYDENFEGYHNSSPKHMCNLILFNYQQNKHTFSKNRHGIIILGKAVSSQTGAEKITIDKTDHHKIRICVKPQQEVTFSFTIENETNKDDFIVVGFQLGHPQPQFKMADHPYIFGEDPHVLKTKSSIEEKISILFQANDIGQYEMPIMFTFVRIRDRKKLIIIREMVVMVQNEPNNYKSSKSPYESNEWPKDMLFMKSATHIPYENTYKIPKLLKILLPLGLEEKSLEGLNEPLETLQKLRLVLISTRAIFDEGLTKENYITYFRHVLWWEEIIAKSNLRKYNMPRVQLELGDRGYYLQVPGLAEKRPSLLRGDRVYIRPKDGTIKFESIVKDIEDERVLLGDFDESFYNHYTENALFDVRFLMSRVPMERMHEAISRVFTSKQASRVFPEPMKKNVTVHHIGKFYNKYIKGNPEQKSAVEHIVAGSSGRAPYIVFGPPGTGKTMTIVEAIIQLVVRNPRNRVMVCTDSNMAADHIAAMLLQYNKTLHISNFLLRASSRTREWTVMPAALAPVSNGTNYENSYSVSNTEMSTYRIVVTTLSHSAKYSSAKNQRDHKLQMSHLFIDEAAQASEPATLIPAAGLLAPAGQLVLAGDPLQLGPVCISKEAKRRGLGTSLLERLKKDYSNMYEGDPNYITMLIQNFRSDPDILKLPNELFYEDQLQALAPPDPLSGVSLLGLPGGDRAVVFHAVHSREQRMGKAPSYFNEMELEMLKIYITALIVKHQVKPEDIGVIAPYIRQVYKIKWWLTQQNYDKVDVGTVESFQGKEKRVILVTTVRANCRLLEYDAKYGLGFLVDDKRFNVAITRAKAKIVIVGNPTCLTRDIKWQKYMDFCKDMGCYFGVETQQLERNTQLLTEIASIRFDKCSLTEELKLKPKDRL